MFSKVFILALLGTVVLANVIVSQQDAEQKLIAKVDEFLAKFDSKVAKYYNKDQGKLDAVVSQLKLKDNKAATSIDLNVANLFQELEEIKTYIKASIEEQKTALLSQLKQLGRVSLEFHVKVKTVFDKERVQFETLLQDWHQKAKDLKDEIKRDVKEIEFEEFFNTLQQNYPAAYEANKEKLNKLKEKYLHVKLHGKFAISQKKLQYKKELLGLKGQPVKYQEVKAQAKMEIAADKAKYSAQKQEIEQEIRQVVQNVRGQI